MDTENVEIIKAMVKTGLGIGIVPYQAIAREVRTGQFFCARIEGHELVRETGWVYARANRMPRVIHELLTAFDRIHPKLRLAPPLGQDPRNPQIQIQILKCLKSFLQSCHSAILQSRRLSVPACSSTETRPPWRSTIALTIERPRPLPREVSSTRRVGLVEAVEDVRQVRGRDPVALRLRPKS